MPVEPPAPEFEPSTPVQYLPGVGAARAERLRRLGLRRAQDVLFFFPREHQFPPPPTRVDDLREGCPATFIGKITDAELVSRTPGKSLFAAIVENDSGAVRIVFFNQPFRAEQLIFDRIVRLSGSPKLAGLRWEFTHPKYELIEADEADAESPENKGEILPVYPLTECVKEYELRRLTRRVASVLAGGVKEVMPPSIRADASVRLREAGIELVGDLPGISTTLRDIHGPPSAEALTAARTRLIFQELFVMQLALAMRRTSLTGRLQAPAMPCTAKIRQRILRRFPFELTADQNRVIDEITREMGRQFPMNRLLQGDVGSGKTVVAIFAMMLAVASGHQATLMAPTEVLARQHYQTLSKILADSRVRIGLLCGSLTAAQRRETLEQIASGELDLIIGTQALVYDIDFHSLGLCVIDEQHKFGVRQRVRLREGGVDPHYLVMSATPIPRSVAMTQFGDVDLSTLREKPAGRGEVHTYLAVDSWRDRWWDFVRQRIAEGRQAYVVAPRVGNESVPRDPSTESPDDLDELTLLDEVEDVTSVSRTFENLRDNVLKEHRVELLHGRMKPEAKQDVMQRFADGEIDVLVSTTVIEVGVDVANATVMTILGGNRFGLAQLHQLRGRISRGVHAGYLCVFTDGEGSPEDSERLKVFEQTSDGFELAEADFRLRGPGDMLGRKQSGLAPLRIADLNRDIEILQVARTMAQELIDEDPGMQAEELAGLRDQVLRRYGDRLDLGDGA
ncbi:ATP-dependent DNA helicase RecG [Aporhodopirellula aestuarii]|uniref:Probable DNA 3'-5' helicase RecG n=1 Tax=Aporhodopirellula aestuarii TaxID=2950107 RepID=A0ABT0UBY9_9BACT|nr:ATP-dependent DNA helicase RecG [Aporhodopirellula aestuarii]MCM2374518.1 ATP-dependent DNA helicase RecG [Aporhodopirellula aestuarii]